jgi:hypothetical protein
MDGSRGREAAERVHQRTGGAGGASGGRWRKARRRRKRFNGTQKILWLAKTNERREDRRSSERDRSREHKQARRNRGTIHILAARHGASVHAGHLVAAVLGIFGAARGMLGMVAVDWALARSATSRGVGRPCGCGKRREKEHDCKHAGDCVERAPAVLTPNGHAVTKPA